MMLQPNKPTAEPPLARIIIIAYNSQANLSDCLERLAAQTDTRFEIVIVDNACPQSSVDKLLSDQKNGLLIRKPGKNLGFAAGCNYGADGASTDWLITLNPDTRVQPDWFATLAQAMEARPEIDAWASTLVLAEDPNRLDGFGDVFSIFGFAWRGGYRQNISLAPSGRPNIFGPCAAAAAYRRDIFERIGGFDPYYFCYLEDVDLAMRLNLAGGSCAIASDAVVHHFGGRSSQDQPQFPIVQTYKNYPYLLTKNLPGFMLIIVWPLYLSVLAWSVFRNRHDGLHASRKAGVKLGWSQIKAGWKARNGINTDSKAKREFWRRSCKSYLKLKHQRIHIYKSE